MTHYQKSFPLLTMLSCLFWQNPIYAEACQNGANASGCSIGTDDTSYNLTGNIDVTGGTKSDSWNNSTDDTAGIEFTTGSDSNDMSLTGDISTTGYRSFGLSLESSDSNTVNLTSDITTYVNPNIIMQGSDAINLESSDSNTINMTGNISTTGIGAEGIYLDESDSNTINMTGDISTLAISQSIGIYLEQSEFNTTNLTGDISTKSPAGSGSHSHGLYIARKLGISTGGGNNTTNIIGNITTDIPWQGWGIAVNTDYNTTNLTGNISTTDGHGYFSTGNHNQTNITGDISTTTGGYGVWTADGSNNNTNITGNISTTGMGGYGVYTTGGGSNTINVTGNISTSAVGGYLIYFQNSDSNTMDVTGDITSTGNWGKGYLFHSSDSNTINMIGDITTTGASAANGIELGVGSDSNTINMTGDITVKAYALKMDSNESNNVNLTGNISTTGKAVFITGGGSHSINLTGDISTTADHSYPIFFGSTDANTTNLTGNISTIGNEAHGIDLAVSDNNTFNVTGDISTTANNTHGIQFWDSSDSNTINITGKVSATGSGSYAVYLNGGGGRSFIPNSCCSTSDNNTVNFNQGSTIIGGIRNDTTNNTFKFKQGVSIIGDIENNGDMTNKLIFDMGKAASYNFDFGSTTWTVEDLHKSVVNGSAKSMGVADIDNQAHILHRRTDSINDVLSERQRLYKEGQRPKGYYIDSYYVHDKRDKDQSQISANAGGVTVGYALENTNTPMEVLVNYEVSKDKYGLGSEQTTESDSLLAGLFLPTLYEDVLGGDISAKVLIGASDNDVKRKVLNNNLGTGASSENVSGDYNSGFVSMGTEWLSEVLKTETVTHDISIGADLVQAYNENYTAGEYTVDSRNMTQLQSRVLYGVTYKNLEKTVDLNARFGIANQQLLSGEKQDYKINGTSVSFTGDDNSLYYTAGLGAKYYLKDNMNLYVDTKYSKSNDDIQDFSIDFGFISRF